MRPDKGFTGAPNPMFTIFNNGILNEETTIVKHDRLAVNECVGGRKRGNFE